MVGLCAARVNFLKASFRFAGHCNFCPILNMYTGHDLAVFPGRRNSVSSKIFETAIVRALAAGDKLTESLSRESFMKHGCCMAVRRSCTTIRHECRGQGLRSAVVQGVVSARVAACRRVVCGVLLAFVVLISAAGVVAESPDGTAGAGLPQGNWELYGAVDVGTVELTSESIREGDRNLQRLLLRNAAGRRTVIITSQREPSRLHDDFRAAVQIQGSHAGIQLAILVVFPHQNDPRTGKPLTTMIPGEVSRVADRWQTLRASGSTAALEKQLRRVRAELNRSDVNAREAYVSGLALQTEAAPGESFVDLDIAEYGPIVVPAAGVVQREVPQDSVAEPREETKAFVPLQVKLNHIVMDGQPAMLRFAPDHGESASDLQRLGLNAVWIPDCRDQHRAGELQDSGLAVLATPPYPEFEPGDYSQLLHSIPPLETLCPRVSGWYLGTRVSPDDQAQLLASSREVRCADRRLQRVQLADVTAAEGAASREIELIGIGRHVIGRSESFGENRNQLLRRQRIAGPLAFPWTWIQTEPSSQQVAWRRRAGARLPQVEFEQILMQVQAAIVSGCKGVGFWKTRQWEAEVPADEETLLGIELACLELRLLEKFLAKGRVDGQLLLQFPGSAETERTEIGSGRRRSGSIQAALNSFRLSTSAAVQEEPDGADATVISSSGSMLIQLVHWDQNSQYVPGHMSASEVSLVVAASETASAWRLSATALTALPRDVVAGGLRLNLRDFDRSASVIVSSDTELIRSVEQMIHQVAARSSQLTIRLASLKYRRVLETTDLLRQLGAVPGTATRLLSQARQSLDRAEHEASQQDHHEAGMHARHALRLLRQVQHLCWQEAVHGMNSPSAAPHSISFATLPDHWRMMQEVRRRESQQSHNLLPDGDFENPQVLSQSGWERDTAGRANVVCHADIVAEPLSGNSILRLAAWDPGGRPSAALVRHDEAIPLVVTAPAVTVQGGDIVRITGRVRGGRVVESQSKRPLLLFDSELGPECGVRMPLTPNWERFEILREIAPGSDSFRFMMALNCMAEAHLDDLSVTLLPTGDGSHDRNPIAPARLTGDLQFIEPR